MLKSAIVFSLFALLTFSETCYGAQTNTIPSLEREVATLRGEVEKLEKAALNKDEMIAMLRIKTAQETEQIEEQEKQIKELKSLLSEYVLESNKCHSSSCLCKETELHTIKIPGAEPFQVSCDSSIAGSGSGWTVIQRRTNGKENFNRDWRDYQRGFGDLQGEFFIGLDKLHLITKSQPHELYIVLQNLNNETRYAKYDSFSIGNDDASFQITSLGKFSGTAGDGLRFHDNMKFSTFDQDNDRSNRNCADENSSGWWFNNCYHCNLNGPYNGGFYWYPWQRNVLKFSQIMIRPKV
ncbi:fibrinogen-like protein 1 [Drosophila nasuta]|uniref:fibrinogen-like protein 1 n=1 Tax=Drosophila nasuta TaxID=42062 RepID=UPI00295E64D2|nr:fibrinogen-like protein 1 [Drosophila nasuta]